MLPCKSHTEEVYVEDLIFELYEYLKNTNHKKDFKLIKSFAKQLKNGIAFTVRQNRLATDKIREYKQIYSDLPEVIGNRLPLREIDRSRWIKITEYPNERTGISYAIAVRFSFDKHLINIIGKMKLNSIMYDSNKKIHYYKYSDSNFKYLIDTVKNQQFQISEFEQDLYDKITSYRHCDYVPGVYDYEIRNISDYGKSRIEERLGEPCSDNIIHYIDRRRQLGLNRIEYTTSDISDYSNLTRDIATRQSPQIQLDPDTVSENQLFNSLRDLKRERILVIVPKHRCIEIIEKMDSGSRDFCDPSEASVMFRLSNNDPNARFNQIIKDRLINNVLTDDTKIAYTLDLKPSKVLFKSGWEPDAAIIFDTQKSLAITKTLQMLTHIDLHIIYDKNINHPIDLFYKKLSESDSVYEK